MLERGGRHDLSGTHGPVASETALGSDGDGAGALRGGHTRRARLGCSSAGRDSPVTAARWAGYMVTPKGAWEEVA